VQLPYSRACYRVDYNGQFIRLQTNFCLVVEFSGNAIAKVLIPRSVYRGLMRGMCGADSGHCSDDYRASNGTYVGHGSIADQTIGDSYVIPDSEAGSNG
jgi:hypothetical protein